MDMDHFVKLFFIFIVMFDVWVKEDKTLTENILLN